MIKLPKKVKIGGHLWDVIFPHRFAESDQEGLCDFQAKIIYVNGYLNNGGVRPDSCIWVSFLHEISHAICNTLALGIFSGEGEKTETVTEELRESRTEAWSEMWFQVLNDNNLLKKPK